MIGKDLFGNDPPPPRQDKCPHTNWEARLPLMGHVDLRSTYQPGTDEVVEVSRSVSWGGQFHGRCTDCGRQLYYGANMPKYIKARLGRIVVPGFDPTTDLLAQARMRGNARH